MNKAKAKLTFFSEGLRIKFRKAALGHSGPPRHILSRTSGQDAERVASAFFHECPERIGEDPPVDCGILET